ncbi:MAG: hypothetical protein P1U36_04920 [Legionellaceae bacterium]|nr:hypothetical protein [Legionellaceae bacterium]
MIPKEKEVEVTAVSSGQSLFETKIQSEGPEHYLGEFLEIKDLVSAQSASKEMYSLFKPAVDAITLKQLLAAVFMGEEWLVVKIAQSNPGLLFERGTYRMPLLNADGSMSEASEQIYYDVTPFQLSLYSGDFQMWGLLLELIPDELKTLARDEVRLFLRGGPDLVKMDRDPRTLPFSALKQFDTGTKDESKAPIIYDLLCNPDGIIYFDDQFFYANQATKEVTLLTPNILPKDVSAFERLRGSLEEDMVMNSSRRTSDVEHALIHRTLGYALERNGIHYSHGDVAYHDTYDSGTRLINAYRKYIMIHEASSDAEKRSPAMRDHWMNIIAKAQRFAPVSIIQRYSPINYPSYPVSRLDAIRGIPLRRSMVFPYVNQHSVRSDMNFFPLHDEGGVGFDFGLYSPVCSGTWLLAKPCHAPHVSWVLNTVLQVVSLRKEAQVELVQALELTLEPSGPACGVVS